MCPQERLVIISKQTGLSFVLKRIEPLAAIISLAFYLLVLYLSAISKPPEYLSVSIYSEFFIETAANTFCSSLGSTLLFIESTTIHPLYLWVIKTIFWRRCRGVKLLPPDFGQIRSWAVNEDGLEGRTRGASSKRPCAKSLG